jgi:hypothetical protein
MIPIKVAVRILAALGAALALSAQDEAALKQRVQTRSQAVVELLTAGAAVEGPDGLLKAAGQLDPQQSRTVREENQDRQAIFAIVAGKSKVPVGDVASMYYKAASARWPPRHTAAGFGPCRLAPASTSDVARLLQYLKQGMNYASQRKFDLALAEFQPALAIDRNFLGLNQNVGSAQLALKKFTEAEGAFKAELKLTECLSGLSEDQLAAFGYFMEVEAKDPAARKKAQAEKLRVELPKVKAAAHYNLACLYSIQRNREAGLESLRAAIQAGFNDRKALASDPDLAFLRKAAGYQQVVASAR